MTDKHYCNKQGQVKESVDPQGRTVFIYHCKVCGVPTYVQKLSKLLKEK